MFAGTALAHIGSSKITANSSSTALAPGDVFKVKVGWSTSHSFGSREVCIRIAQRTPKQKWTSLLGKKFKHSSKFGTKTFTLIEPKGFTPGPGTIRVTLDDGNNGRNCRIPAAGSTRQGFKDIKVTKLSGNQPPDCSKAAPSVSTLWPPNHKFKPVTITGVTDPDGDPITITVASIRQDEPVNGKGDGNTSPDGQGVGSDTAEVRAERSGKGDGRVYAITFVASDGKGGKCKNAVSVGVPHNKKDTAVDSGTIYDSTIP